MERHKNGDCWRVEELIEQDLGIISVAIAKKAKIKNQIIIWVIVFEMMKHHAPWSHKGSLQAFECLKEHLIWIVKDVARLNKEIKQPHIKATARNFLTGLGQETANVRQKDEEENKVKSRCYHRVMTCDLNW